MNLTCCLERSVTLLSARDTVNPRATPSGVGEKGRKEGRKADRGATDRSEAAI